MLAAENSDFGVTEELLEETLIVQGQEMSMAERPMGCWSENTQNMAHWCCIHASCSCWGSAGFAINVYLDCLNSLPFRMFI